MEKTTVTLITITPEARAKAIRRALRDDSQVTLHVTDPRRTSARAAGTVMIPVTAEARARAIRRALRDDSKVTLHVTDPRRSSS